MKILGGSQSPSTINQEFYFLAGFENSRILPAAKCIFYSSISPHLYSCLLPERWSSNATNYLQYCYRMQYFKGLTHLLHP